MRNIWLVPAVLLLPCVLAFCKESDGEGVETSFAAQTSDAAAPAAPDPADEDVVAYAELCKRELGITQPLPAMSCLAGTEVPITIDGQPVTQANYASLSDKGCDNPQWLTQSCHNYDFVQRIDVGNPDVEAILNCRQKYFTNAQDKTARASAVADAPADEKVDKYKLLAEFNDLGFILRNKKTGKSCFFTIFGNSYNGAWLPGPDATTLPPKATVAAALQTAPPEGYPEASWYRDARATYFTPRATSGGGCVRCHDLGAFKHSPFIDQVDIVPTTRSKTTPYLLVGNVFQQAFRDNQMTDVTTEPVDGASQKCTQCHRLAAGGASCSTFVDWATGHDPSPHTDSSKRYPAAAWMPLDHEESSAESYDAAFGKHIARMKCCCAKPNARGCKTRTYGPTSADVGGTALPEWRAADPAAADSCL